MGGQKSLPIFWDFNIFFISLQKDVKMKDMIREYKGEMFRKFALKLKKEGLWQKFIVLEYYFRFYSNLENSLIRLYRYLKNENNDEVLSLDWVKGKEKGRYGSYLDSMLFSEYDRQILLSDFYKHYKV